MEPTNKVAVVTGAASGVGRGIARRMAAHGARVVLADLDEQGLDVVVREIEDSGGAASAVATDVVDPAQVDSLAQAALTHFGAVHIVCNNAGIGPVESIAETSTELWARTLAINLWGPINGVRTFLPILEEQGEGHINATASESGLYAIPFLAAYNASKHGVVGLMATLARELRASGSAVTASVLCPGAVATSIVDNMPSDNQLSSATQTFRANVRAAVEGGMSPDEVGEKLIAGIGAGRFWIFTHEHVPAAALAQAQQMVADGTLPDLG